MTRRPATEKRQPCGYVNLYANAGDKNAWARIHPDRYEANLVRAPQGLTRKFRTLVIIYPKDTKL